MSLFRRRPKRHIAQIAAIDRVSVGLTVGGRAQREQVGYRIVAQVLTGPDAGAVVTWAQPDDRQPGTRCFLPDDYALVRYS